MHAPADQPRGLVELDRARGRLRAALAAVLVPAEAPELTMVDRWRGVGLPAVGLHRTGYDLNLGQYGVPTGRSTTVAVDASAVAVGADHKPAAGKNVVRI